MEGPELISDSLQFQDATLNIDDDSKVCHHGRTDYLYTSFTQVSSATVNSKKNILANLVNLCIFP